MHLINLSDEMILAGIALIMLIMKHVHAKTNRQNIFSTW